MCTTCTDLSYLCTLYLWIRHQDQRVPWLFLALLKVQIEEHGQQGEAKERYTFRVVCYILFNAPSKKFSRLAVKRTLMLSIFPCRVQILN